MSQSMCFFICAFYSRQSTHFMWAWQTCIMSIDAINAPKTHVKHTSLYTCILTHILCVLIYAHIMLFNRRVLKTCRLRQVCKTQVVGAGVELRKNVHSSNCTSELGNLLVRMRFNSSDYNHIFENTNVSVSRLSTESNKLKVLAP